MSAACQERTVDLAVVLIHIRSCSMNNSHDGGLHCLNARMRCLSPTWHAEEDIWKGANNDVSHHTFSEYVVHGTCDCVWDLTTTTAATMFTRLSHA